MNDLAKRIQTLEDIEAIKMDYLSISVSSANLQI